MSGGAAPKPMHCADPSKPAPLRAAPADGGYRRLADEETVQKLREEMAKVETVPSASDRRVTQAVSDALDDLAGELQRCLRAADAPKPDQRYVVRVYLDGNSMATVVSRVALKRVEMKGTTAVEIATKAEPCFNNIFHLLELPPSTFVTQYSTTFRADFCRDQTAEAGIASAR
jgi:hypothetical protein